MGLIGSVRAAEMQYAKAMFCDTAEQVAEYYDLVRAGTSRFDAQVRVNQDAGRIVCETAFAAFAVEETAQMFFDGGLVHMIYRVRITALPVSSQVMVQVDLEQYVLFSAPLRRADVTYL